MDFELYQISIFPLFCILCVHVYTIADKRALSRIIIEKCPLVPKHTLHINIEHDVSGGQVGNFFFQKKF